MDIAVSPYHLTTREAPAMVALALARRVLTVLPGGDAGSGVESGLARAVPSFGKFMKSWSWTVPLWKAGVISTQHDGQSLDGDVWEVTRHIEREAACLPLRHFVRRHEFEDQRTYLHAVANDLLKGGPDPGISLPVAAGLDRFATRRGVLVARGPATSLAQRAETSLATPLFSVVVPVFLQATAPRVLHYREVLGDQVARLGAACERVLRTACGDPSTSTSADAREVVLAAAALTSEFAARADELRMGSSDDDVRPIEGAVSIAAVTLPWDAVLKSSVRAIEHLSPRSVVDAPAASTAVLDVGTHPVLYDGVSGKSFVSLVVRPVGQSKGLGTR